MRHGHSGFQSAPLAFLCYIWCYIQNLFITKIFTANFETVCPRNLLKCLPVMDALSFRTPRIDHLLSALHFRESSFDLDNLLIRNREFSNNHCKLGPNINLLSEFHSDSLFKFLQLTCILMTSPSFRSVSNIALWFFIFPILVAIEFQYCEAFFYVHLVKKFVSFPTVSIKIFIRFYLISGFFLLSCILFCWAPKIAKCKCVESHIWLLGSQQVL